MAYPTAIPGATASANFQIGSLSCHSRKSTASAPPMNPPYHTSPDRESSAPHGSAAVSPKCRNR